MKLKLSRFFAAAAAVALAALAGTAQARDNIYWSIGVDAAPGVTLGVGNVRPVMVAPAPVLVAPPPIYVAPRPVVVSQPVVYARPVVVYDVYPRHGKHRKWHHKHRHHHRH